MSVPSTFVATGLTKAFRLPRTSLTRPGAEVVAVDDISFSVETGRTLGIVGESGSGKTTVARMLLKLERPTAGQLLFESKDVFAQDREGERAYRRSVQAVLQDPYGALSPRLSVAGIMTEPLMALGGTGKTEARDRAVAMLARVGLPASAMERFPHHFSGGQRQRIAIARALTVNPKVLILDEPVSALDVSIRAQILELLRSMQAETGLTYLFIGHDLATVRYMSHTVAVMYFGRLMEVAPAPVLFRQPLHPYTRRLVALASSRERIGRSRLQGELPDPTKRIAGCAFRSRCPWAQPVCAEQAPALREIAPGHRAACHFAEDIAREADLSAHALQQEPSHAERHPDIAAMGRAGAEQYDRWVVP